MRRVFFVSVLLMVLTAVIAWAALRLAASAPATEPGTDAGVRITVLRDGAVQTVSLADWLPGVVAAEMPAAFEPEALRAQAVAARSYILDRAAHRPASHPDADVCDDPGCCTAWLSEETLRERWGTDAQQNLARIRAAVTDTDGEVLQYAGEAIRAVFHSSSAGRTESSAALWGDVPYLVSVSSPETEEEVPNFVSTQEISAEMLRETVCAAHPDCALPEDPAAWLGVPQLDESGRVASLAVGSVTLTGAELRRLLGLRSTAFTAELVDGVFRFTTTGYGHGVGMSQYGANAMAKQGSGYAEILSHYYPGTTLCKLKA